MNINGKLAFDASAASVIENLRIQRFAAVANFPAWTAADAGRLIYAIAEQAVYYGDSNSWEPLATGGSAFPDAEGQNLITSLGAGVDSVGVFVPSGFTDSAAGATSFTDAINQVAAAAAAADTLAELDDVSLSAAVPTTPSFLYTPGNGDWVDHTLVVADITNLTVSAAQINNAAATTSTTAELNTLDGITALVGDLNLLTGGAAGTGAFAGDGAITSANLAHLQGTTDNIQDQLDASQDGDAGLDSLAALTGPGFVTVNADGNTFSARSLVEPAAGLTISNPTGAGNSVFALANDLAALEGLGTTGYIVRTGDGTATTRAIVGTTDNIVVTNGSGVSSDTTVDLATVSQAASGDFVKVTLDGFGRVTGNTPVVTADITALVDSTYVNVGGDTMTGSLTLSGGSSQVILPNAPVSGNHATNKAYVDALSAGLTWKKAVVAASTAPLTLATGFAAGEVIDGVTLVLGDRILVKNQGTAAENGIYIVTAGAPTRAEDMDTADEFSSATVFVQNGTTQADSGWTQTATVTTVGTDAVTFVQFTGAGTFVAGIGLSLTGNTFDVNLGAGIAELGTDNVGVHLFNSTTGAIILTDNGTTRATSNTSMLHLLLAGSGGLTQDATGLYIPAAGVTNAMLVNDGVGLNGDTGVSTLDLGQTLEIIGDSVQGIVTDATAQTITITASNASASQKGVASFAAADFTVTAGNVVIAAGGVDNAQLANSTLNFIGTDASADTVALGGSLTFASAVANLVTATVATDIVTLGVRLASTSATGVASFNTNHFSVTAGAVDLAATLADLTNVSGDGSAGDLLLNVAGVWTPTPVDTVVGNAELADLSDVDDAAVPTDGHVLTGNGTAWVNQKIYHLHDEASAATTWTVTHGLGQQYCNVTVVVGNEVVIPQSITFDSTTVVTITFNTAVAGKAVVMGIA